jgi:hypothetical protein
MKFSADIIEADRTQVDLKTKIFYLLSIGDISPYRITRTRTFCVGRVERQLLSKAGEKK